LVSSHGSGQGDLAKASLPMGVGASVMLSSAARDSGCGSNTCCCLPSNMCVSGRSAGSMQAAWKADMDWMLSPGESMSLEHTCGYEWWELSDFQEKPAFYSRWNRSQWNSAHEHHDSIPALIKSYQQAQIYRCRHVHEGLLADMLPYGRSTFSDTATRNTSVAGAPVATWEVSTLLIYLKFKPGRCPEYEEWPECCAMLQVTFHAAFRYPFSPLYYAQVGADPEISVRGPICGKQCYLWPYIPIQPAHRSTVNRVFMSSVARGLGPARSLKPGVRYCARS
jgi:hypothetical protein